VSVGKFCGWAKSWISDRAEVPCVRGASLHLIPKDRERDFEITSE
jgi:hypothetical protein